MNSTNIQKETDRVRKTLIEVKQDAEILIRYVDDGLCLIDGVKTMEDALAFDSLFDDLEGELKHIQIF